MPTMFAIENAEGTKFLTQYGWMANRSQAYKFTSRDEAERHMNLNGSLRRDGAKIMPINWEDSAIPAANGHAATEYDPFGLKRS